MLDFTYFDKIAGDVLRSVLTLAALVTPVLLGVQGGGSDSDRPGPGLGLARPNVITRHSPLDEVAASAPSPLEVAASAPSPLEVAASSPGPLEGVAASSPSPLGEVGRGRQHFGHGPRTSFRPSSTPRELILTFDDGPDLKSTPLVLEELDRRGLKGIFFIAGWRLVGDRPEVLARRDLVRKLASHGHLIGNHTINHKNLCRETPLRQAEEIDGNTELISHATGLRPLLFRSPYGAFCRSLEAALEARDLVDVGWNLDPQDWAGNDEDTIFTYLTTRIERLSGRGIVLLHDTNTAAVHALPRVLDWLERENDRAREEGRPPVEILDYSVMLPEHRVPRTGLEAILDDLAAPFGLLPGVAAAWKTWL